jgi:hypothetical protein
MTKLKPLLLSLLLEATVVAQPQITVRSPLSWLQIISASDPTFTAKATQIAGANLSQIASVLPYSVIVTNAGKTSVYAIGMRWEVAYHNRATPVVRNFFLYAQYGKSVIPVGQSRMFTPVQEFTTIVAPTAAGTPGTGGPAPHTPSVNAFKAINSLASSPSMVVSADLVIDPQGNTAGADLANTIGSLLATLADDASMRSQLQNQLSDGVPTQTIINWLQSVVAAPIVVSPGQESLVRVAAHRRSLAEGWLSDLQAGRPADLQGIWPELEMAKTINKGGLQ